MADPFDIPDLIGFPAHDQRKGTPRFSGAARSSDAVHVVFDILGYVKIEDGFYVTHVDASGSYIGSDQDIRFPAAKQIHHGVALPLRQIAVQSLHLVASAL